MTEPKKQDGTIELDVGQIDLLDLPLPPSSRKSLEEPHAESSKGPPPLPPLETAPAPAAKQQSAEADEATPPKGTPVPSLPPPPEPKAPPAAAISARKLVDGPPSGASAIVRFLLGMGAASIVCVGGFFALRALHTAKTPPAPAASASAAPTQSFTMAPIEFTEPAASESASASAAGATSAPPAATTAAPAPTAATTTAPSHASSGTHATHPASSSKPAPRPDDLIKVEN